MNDMLLCRSYPLSESTGNLFPQDKAVDAPLATLLSKRDAVSLLELINASLSVSREDDLKKLVVGVQSLIPFDFAVCALAKEAATGAWDDCDVVIINITYPEEWLDLYVRNNFCEIDPVAKENFTAFKVQYWADTYRKYGHPEEFIELAEQFNLREGYTCGVGDHTGRGGSLFSLAGEVQDHPRNRSILGTLAPHLHQALSRVAAGPQGKTNVILSAREKEILTWIRQGKSSWEISVILGISERTVKFHVSTVMGKLDAVSRSHAVAIAMSMGLIAVD